jgi:hypothetical protein
MALICGRPASGTHVHIFEEGGDGRSLCTRAPATIVNPFIDLSKVDCVNCKRAYEMCLRHFMGPSPIEITLPAKKKGTPRTARRTATGTLKSKGTRSKGTLRKKRSKKGA